MASVQWLLDLLLAALLAATLVRATRLERALGALRKDRGALDVALGALGDSTRDAGQGIETLRRLTEGAGRQVVRHAEQGTALKDDLAFLIERGDRLADRMDALVRLARPAADATRFAGEPPRPAAFSAPGETAALPASAPAAPVRAATGRVPSLAERELLAALKAQK